jgi:hypothetical protein
VSEITVFPSLSNSGFGTKRDQPSRCVQKSCAQEMAMLQFSELLHIRAPAALAEAVRSAAARDMGSISDFVRRCLLKELRSLGIDPAINQRGRDD